MNFNDLLYSAESLNNTFADYKRKKKQREAPAPEKPPTTERKMRISKADYYLQIAKSVALRSTCLRRKYGAIVVNRDTIVSTGYNGAPRGRENCCDLGICKREQLHIPHGERYELCRSVHAEQNAIIAAGYEKTFGATLYLAGIDAQTEQLIDAPDCCMMCKRVIINAGISQVIFLNGDGTQRVVKTDSWITEED